MASWQKNPAQANPLAWPTALRFSHTTSGFFPKAWVLIFNATSSRVTSSENWFPLHWATSEQTSSWPESQAQLHILPAQFLGSHLVVTASWRLVQWQKNSSGKRQALKGEMCWVSHWRKLSVLHFQRIQGCELGELTMETGERYNQGIREDLRHLWEVPGH